MVGLDLSSSVGQVAENRHAFAQQYSLFVHFVQGNLMEPLFVEKAFDHLHTICDGSDLVEIGDMKFLTEREVIHKLF